LGIAKKIPNTNQNVLGTTKKDFSHYINHSNDYTFVGSFEFFFWVDYKKFVTRLWRQKFLVVDCGN
jgi:hypothetical protein